MKKITLIATAKFGLEKMVKLEVMDLGFKNIRVSPGRIEFDATLADIPKANLGINPRIVEVKPFGLGFAGASGHA